MHATSRLDAIFAQARQHPSRFLSEADAIEVLHLLGIQTPPYRLLRPEETPFDVDVQAFLLQLATDRVVVKAVSSEIPPQSHLASTAVVECSSKAIEAAIQRMRETISHLAAIDAFSLQGFVPHPPSFGHEMRLWMHWTPEHGSLVILSLGGLHAQFLAKYLADTPTCCVFSPSQYQNLSQIEAALDHDALCAFLTHPLHTQPPILSRDHLAQQIQQWLDIANTLLPRYAIELEINPMIWTEQGWLAIDILLCPSRSQ